VNCCAYPHLVGGESWDVVSRSRVISGLGSVSRLGALLEERGARRVLIVTDPGLRKTGMVDDIAASIGGGVTVTVHSDVPANPTTASVDVATDIATDARADTIVAIGGGSALDASKAVALQVDPREPLPIVAIPTTAGTGAETNGFAVIETVDHRKVYPGSERTVPALVILDAELTVGLPTAVTAACGFDAIVHGAESLLSRSATAMSRAYAAESLRLTAPTLATAVTNGGDIEARSRMLLGAHLAGRALTLSGLGIVHGIAHSITATLGTPHGVALASIAGPAMRFGIDAAPAAYGDLARALTVESGAAAVDLIMGIATEVGLPTTSGTVGVTSDLIDTIVAKALEDPVTNNTPHRPTIAELTDLLAAGARA
jgi:alcohol dehydrogenase class IV